MQESKPSLEAIGFLAQQTQNDVDNLSKKFDEYVETNGEQNERLTRLEEKADQLQEGQKVIHARIDRTNSKMDAIEKKVNKIDGGISIIKWAVIVGATLAGGILAQLRWG